MAFHVEVMSVDLWLKVHQIIFMIDSESIDVARLTKKNENNNNNILLTNFFSLIERLVVSLSREINKKI